MRKIKHLCLVCAALALTATASLGADAVAPRFYKLDFVVKEVDGGKVLNSRSYSTTVTTKENAGCQIRTNSKIPIPTSFDGSQFTFYNAGTSIDCSGITDVPNGLSLRVSSDVTSAVLPEGQTTTAASRQPVIRENRWDSTVVVPLKKPTVIFSSDDATTKHQMQLELTATPIT